MESLANPFVREHNYEHLAKSAPLDVRVRKHIKSVYAHLGLGAVRAVAWCPWAWCAVVSVVGSVFLCAQP